MRTINGPIQDFCHPITMLRKGSSWPRIEIGRRIRSPVSSNRKKNYRFIIWIFLVTSVKSGESNWPSPRSEKLPVPFLLLKKKTQRDYLKVMLFSVDWSELVSSQKTKWNSITSSVSKSRTSSKDVSKPKARIIQSSTNPGCINHGHLSLLHL